MIDNPTDIIRPAAMAGIVGAALTAASGAIVQLLVQPSTTVSDKMWSYPWSSTAIVPVSILWASFHVLVAIGILGLRASGTTGSSRAGRRGISLALIGTALLFVGELASIPVRHARISDTSASLVGLIFFLAIVLSAVGFLIAGRSTLRARRWDGWRRYPPLAMGIWTTALLVVSATKALPAGVAVYGVFLLAVFCALFTAPASGDSGDVLQPAFARPQRSPA